MFLHAASVCQAAGLGHRDIVQTVTGRVRDLKDEPDNDGFTPIFYAAAGKQDDVYDMLVKAGADVQRLDKVRSLVKVVDRSTAMFGLD